MTVPFSATISPAPQGIRLATPDDIATLTERNDRLVGVGYYPWAERLGNGADRVGYLALVAERDGRVVGHLAIGNPNLRQGLAIYDTGRSDVAALPWWKLHALAVEPDAQGRGVATDLLATALGRLPRPITGIYGGVADDRSAAITWYRHRGFYIATPMTLPYHAGDSTGVGVIPLAGEVFFRADVAKIRRHLHTAQTLVDELATAQKEAERDRRQRDRGGMKPRLDVGYRSYAHRVLAQPAPSCLHADFGPRPFMVSGWDPQKMRVCAGCTAARLDAIRTYDDEALCDGCGLRRPGDVELSWAQSDLVTVAAGLCSRCRAAGPLARPRLLAGQPMHETPGGIP